MFSQYDRHDIILIYLKCDINCEIFTWFHNAKKYTLLKFDNFTERYIILILKYVYHFYDAPKNKYSC